MSKKLKYAGIVLAALIIIDWFWTAVEMIHGDWILTTELEREIAKFKHPSSTQELKTTLITDSINEEWKRLNWQ